MTDGFDNQQRCKKEGDVRKRKGEKCDLKRDDNTSEKKGRQTLWKEEWTRDERKRRGGNQGGVRTLQKQSGTCPPEALTLDVKY